MRGEVPAGGGRSRSPSEERRSRSNHLLDPAPPACAIIVRSSESPSAKVRLTRGAGDMTRTGDGLSENVACTRRIVPRATTPHARDAHLASPRARCFAATRDASLARARAPRRSRAPAPRRPALLAPRPRPPPTRRPRPRPRRRGGGPRGGVRDPERQGRRRVHRVHARVARGARGRPRVRRGVRAVRPRRATVRGDTAGTSAPPSPRTPRSTARTRRRSASPPSRTARRRRARTSARRRTGDPRGSTPGAERRRRSPRGNSPPSAPPSGRSRRSRGEEEAAVVPGAMNAGGGRTLTLALALDERGRRCREPVRERGGADAGG